MKLKYPLLLITVLSFAAFVRAQDIIVFRNGKEKKVILTRVGIDKIEFTMFRNPEGRTRSEYVSNLFIIKYQNGKKDVIMSPALIGSKSTTSASQYEYEHYMTLYHKELVKGIVMTSIGGTLILGGLLLVRIGAPNINSQTIGPLPGVFVVFGTAMGVAGIPWMILGPLKIIKAKKFKRKAEEAGVYMNVTPLLAPALDNSNRAMNYRAGAGMRIRF